VTTSTDIATSFFSEMLDSLSERVARFRADDHVIVYCNEAWAAAHAEPASELIGRSLDELLGPAEREGLAIALRRLSREHSILLDPEPRPAPDTPGRWIEWVDHLLSGPDGDEILAVGRDVTERVETAKQLECSEAQFRALADHSPDVVLHLSFDPFPHFDYVSPSFGAVTSISADELRADPLALAGVLEPATFEMLADALSGHPLPERFDAKLRRPDGTIAVFELRTTAVPGGLQAICRDVSEIREMQAKLADLALRDELTGLANRRLVTEVLDGALRGKQRSRETLGVAFIDVDGLKVVNDTYGHAAGDAVLRETARRLEAAVRAGDLVARVGGDEFVIVYRTDEPSPARLLDRLTEALEAPIELGNGRTVHSGASIGIADTSHDTTDAATLLGAADAAMYEVKKSRKASRVHPALG
jgi:diguanylate cyclase (GGDEF)-like protein/PAS domain S-box-containing protein